MTSEKKLLALLVFIYMAVMIPGIKWGVPSNFINSLYFSEPAALEKRLEKIEGEATVLHDDVENGLPRYIYNPIRSYHPDEYFVIKSMADLSPENLDFRLRQFSLGGAYLYPLGALFLLSARAGWLHLTREISYYFLQPEGIARMYLLGRLVTIFFGLGIVILTYLTALDIWKEKKAAFLAGFLTIFSPLVLLNCHFMYVDIPGVFWIMAALFLAVRYIRRPSANIAFFMGAAAGLAAGSKLTFLLAFFMPAAALLLSAGRGAIKKTAVGLIYSFTGFAIFFVATNPYFLSVLKELFWGTGQQNLVFLFQPGFYFNSLMNGLGVLPLVFLLAGFICALIKDYTREKALLAGWIIFLFLMLSSSAGKFARYILPAIPPLIIGGTGFWLRFSAGKTTWFVKKSIVLLVAAAAFFYGMSYKMLFLGENTRTEAGIWIKENITAGSSIGVAEVPWQFQLPPFDQERYGTVVAEYDFEELEKAAPDYFIFSSFQAPIVPYPLRLQPERIAFWEEFTSSDIYEKKITFKRFPGFAGAVLRTETLPEDMIYLNPSIAVFEKKQHEEDI